MQLIENIKDYFGKAKLNSLLKMKDNRDVSFCNLNNAKKIGLLIELKEERDYQELSRFIETLKGDYGVRNVRSLVYFSKKEEPSFLQSRLSLDFLLPTDVNWQREPLKEVAKTFKNEEFDILIDLTEGLVIPLRNILVTSKARFKVGRFSEGNSNYYDFMIDAGQTKFSQFTQELVRYLTTINEK